MPKNKGTKGQLTSRGITGGTKMEPPVIILDAQIKLGGLLKEMPKNEGTKGQLIGRGIIGGSVLVPPINTATYSELGIKKKAAMQWQQMFDHEAEIH